MSPPPRRAVALNLTATGPTHGGDIDVYPTGGSAGVSNLNFAAGETVANLVLARPNSSGQVTFANHSSGGVQLVGDIQGYYVGGTATAPGAYHPLAPKRIVDTRDGTGTTKAKVASRGTLTVTLAGKGGLPAAGQFSAAAINVTAVDSTKPGDVTVYPADKAKPTASNLNFAARQVKASLVLTAVSTAGAVKLYNNSSQSIDLLIDVQGYFDGTTAPTAVGTYKALTPFRFLDTREGKGTFTASKAPVPGLSAISVAVLGQGGVPTTGVTAVAVNVTATSTTSNGFVTVFPSSTALPTASNLNFVSGATVPNLVLVPIGPDGRISLYNGAGGTSALVADVQGYVLGS